LDSVHYKTDGNLWQRWFGGANKVALSTQVTYTGSKTHSSASIEDTRDVDVGESVYFGLHRAVTVKLPTDCDSIEIDITMTAVKNDNLSGALNILNGDELKSTLSLAPGPAQSALAIANVVKKLLTAAGPQSQLQVRYAGTVGVKAVEDPTEGDYLAQGRLILLYRENDDDTGLDGLDYSKLSIDHDQLRYEGQFVQNTYVLLSFVFEEVRGADKDADWFGVFQDAMDSLDALASAADDNARLKAWATAYATYKQAAKLLRSDPSYTEVESDGITAAHLVDMQSKYQRLSGKPAPQSENLKELFSHISPEDHQIPDDRLSTISEDYREKIARSNLTLSGSSLKRTLAIGKGV
jgi:hypothetical protein